GARPVAIEGEAKPRTVHELHRAVSEGAQSQLRTVEVQQHADRSIEVGLDRADQREPLLVVGMRAVAEVQSEHVGAGANQRLDGGAIRARGAEGGDDLGVAGALHQVPPVERPSMTMALKSFTLVSVGPVTTESPSASKKPWPSLSSRRSRGRRPCAQARASVSGVSTAPAISSWPST